MNLENYIEGQYRDLMDSSQLNMEYADLYKTIKHQKLREIFMTLHHDLILLFKTMNERLPTDTSVGAHFWAEPSRDLIKRIDIIFGLMNTLKGTELAFELTSIILNCWNNAEVFYVQVAAVSYLLICLKLIYTI